MSQPGTWTPDRPSRPTRAVSIGNPAVSGVVDSGDWVLFGWSIRETTGSATAIVELIDGGDANGQLLATIALNPGQSVTDYPGEHGPYVSVGLFLVVVSGSVKGVVWERDA